MRKLFAWGAPEVPDDDAKKHSDRQATSLAEAAASNTACASKLQLIGLTRVRTALGPRWPELAERVRSVADTVIRKHVLRGDVYEQNGDDGYLVLFVDLSIEDARFKADSIAREIERRLIGCNLAEVAACSFDVAMVNPNTALSAPASVLRDLKTPTRANSEPEDHIRHRTVSGSGSDTGAGPFRLAPGTDTKNESRTLLPAGQLSAAEETQLLPHKVPAASSRTTETPSEPHRVASRASDRPATPRKFLCKPSDVRWFYRPVWDFRNSALLLFALLPQRTDDSELIIGDEVLRSDDAEFVAELDIMAMQKAARDMTDLAKSARRLPLLVQVHHVSIADARRRAFFLAALKRIPAEYHKLLFLELVGFPQNYVTLGISSFAAELHAAHIRIAMRVDPLQAIPATLDSCGAALATVMFPAAMPEAEQMAALEDFAATALHVKLDCGVWNIRTRSMAIAAASSGIRYLSGGAIAQASPRLTGAMRYSLDELFSLA